MDVENGGSFGGSARSVRRGARGATHTLTSLLGATPAF